MTQEELKQFKELLVKANQALPGCTTFWVKEEDQGLILEGENIYVVNGNWDSYKLLPNGEIEHKNGVVY